MIVDIHTHTPRVRSSEGRAPARPDRPDTEVVTAEDYMRAMEFVDRAVVFGIAPPPPGDPFPSAVPADVSAATAREVNDATAAFVRANPHKLIGFMSVHPRDPQLLEE